MYCKICGATLTPGDVFCKNCGASNTNPAEPKAPEVEPASAVESIQEPNMVDVPSEPTVNDNAPVAEPNMVGPVVDNVPVEPVPEPVNNVEPNSTPSEEKVDKSGKFLVIIGVVVGLLAAAVVSYLIYSSLNKKNNNGDNPNVTVVTQIGYSARYAGYDFKFNSENLVTIDDALNIKSKKWNAKIYNVTTPDYASLTVDNIKKYFETVTDYKIADVSSKNYSDTQCFETNVTYNNNAKTVLLLCKNTNGGYWSIEVGLPDYANYPTSNISSEVVGLVSGAKLADKEDTQLNTGKIQIELEAPMAEETQNQ